MIPRVAAQPEDVRRFRVDGGPKFLRLAEYADLEPLAASDMLPGISRQVGDSQRINVGADRELIVAKIGQINQRVGVCRHGWTMPFQAHPRPTCRAFCGKICRRIRQLESEPGGRIPNSWESSYDLRKVTNRLATFISKSQGGDSALCRRPFAERDLRFDGLEIHAFPAGDHRGS